MIILGIDPGTATTGWGVVDSTNPKKMKSVDYGQIKTSKDHFMTERLLKIYDSTKHLVQIHKPDVIVIEQLFFNTNTKTAITVGQARGIYILVAGEFRLPVFDYTALQAKMELTGYGRAEKKDVRIKVKEILNIHGDIKPIDASDALALAICHTYKATGNDKKSRGLREKAKEQAREEAKAARLVKESKTKQGSSKQKK